MRDTITDLANWPRTRNDQPIIKSTNEAFLYAQLIYNQPTRQAALIKYRQEAYKQLKVQRDRKNPNLNIMMGTAVKAQFFRECLEECKRIKDEKSNH